MKISEKLNKPVENLPPSYIHYRFLYNLHFFLLWEKVKIFEFLKTNDWTNGFALSHDKKWQIYFFCVKHQAKTDFLKDIKSTVG